MFNMHNDSFSPRKPNGDNGVLETSNLEESDGEGLAQYEKFKNISLSSNKVVNNTRLSHTRNSFQDKKFVGSFVKQQSSHVKKKGR